MDKRASQPFLFGSRVGLDKGYDTGISSDYYYFVSDLLAFVPQSGPFGNASGTSRGALGLQHGVDGPIT